VKHISPSPRQTILVIVSIDAEFVSAPPAATINSFSASAVPRGNIRCVALFHTPVYVRSGTDVLKDRDKYPSFHQTIIAIVSILAEFNSALGATVFPISHEIGVSRELIRCFASSLTSVYVRSGTDVIKTVRQIPFPSSDNHRVSLNSCRS
jgi:hypothetical protein